MTGSLKLANPIPAGWAGSLEIPKEPVLQFVSKACYCSFLLLTEGWSFILSSCLDKAQPHNHSGQQLALLNVHSLKCESHPKIPHRNTKNDIRPHIWAPWPCQVHALKSPVQGTNPLPHFCASRCTKCFQNVITCPSAIQMPLVTLLYQPFLTSYKFIHFTEEVT